jgi:predicted PurR-regulated permease PerM
VRRLEDYTLLLLVIIVSLVFAWILWPFFGAVLWAAVLAIVFAPLHQRLLRSMPKKRNLAGLIIVLIIMALVILPLTVTVASLVEEAESLHQKIQSGELDFGRFFQEVLDALPAWATDLLDRLGLANLGAIKERLSAALMKGSSFFAAQALDIGWGTANFIVGLLVMLYLLFFFVRDGDAISKRITDAIPLPADQQRALISRSTTVIRAMVKGNLLVATVQGALGGLILATWDPRSGFMGFGDGSSVLVACRRVCASLASSRHLSAGDRCRMARCDSDSVWHLRHGLCGQLVAATSRRQRHADARLPCTDFYARWDRNLRS